MRKARYFVLLDSFKYDYTKYQLGQLYQQLSQYEKERLHHFRFQRDKLEYLQLKVKLRCLLAEYLDCSAQEVPIEINENGKPGLNISGAPFFNISHCNNYYAIAVNLDNEVGVDIEMVDRSVPATSIAKSMFHVDECFDIGYSIDPIDSFYRIWTSKEAYVKAKGVGLTQSTSEFSIQKLKSSDFYQAVEAKGNSIPNTLFYHRSNHLHIAVSNLSDSQAIRPALIWLTTQNNKQELAA